MTENSLKEIEVWTSKQLDPGSSPLSDTSTQACGYDKEAKRHFGAYCFPWNSCFAMAEMAERIATALFCCTPCPDRTLRVVELPG